MRFLLIGGHTRNIGKTALVVDIIRAFPEARWTAAKITQYGHGVCSSSGEMCDCAPREHAFSVDEETSRENHTDTSRFLVAGAARSLWVRANQGHLGDALPALRAALADCENVIIESNSLMAFLRPSLYLVVLDPQQSDFKVSAKLYLDRADAAVLRAPLGHNAWQGVSPALLAAIPKFSQEVGHPLPAPLVEFIREKYFQQGMTFESLGVHLSS
jgi:hypothetical protein